MHAVDQYLEAALTVIDDLPSDMMEGTKVKKVYKGYIASFGTIVKQSGLLPAAVLFGKTGGNDRSEGNKKHVTELLLKILRLKSKDLNAGDFIAYARHPQSSRSVVLHVAVALKIALRTKEFTNS